MVVCIEEKQSLEGCLQMAVSSVRVREWGLPLSLFDTRLCAKGQPCDRLVLSSVGLNLPRSFQTFPPAFIQCQSTGLDFQTKDETENSLLIPQLNYSIC